MSAGTIFVTGAGGFLGTQLVRALAARAQPAAFDGQAARIVAADVRETPAHLRVDGVEYLVLDVRSPELGAQLERCRPDVVVHLAAIVTPGRRSNREFEYSVDVLGTRNVLQACLQCGASRIVVASSGAAYGYHADHPAWIDEDCALRGNEAFAYSWHKRLVEEMLARWRLEHPRLGQVVLRIGTILGETVDNQITALFERKRPIAIRGSDSPFVFVWDEDVVACIEHAIDTGATGIYNVAGDGALTIGEIAARMGKRCRVLPAGFVRAALSVLRALRLTQYGPEQVDFLRYRPVLSNERLKTRLGYTPRKSSSEAFDAWLAARRARSPAEHAHA